MVQAPKPANPPAVTAFDRRPISFAFSKVTVDSLNMLKVSYTLPFVLHNSFPINIMGQGVAQTCNPLLACPPNRRAARLGCVATWFVKFGLGCIDGNNWLESLTPRYVRGALPTVLTTPFSKRDVNTFACSFENWKLKCLTGQDLTHH